LCETSIELTPPGQGRPACGYGWNLLIPQVQFEHWVTPATNRTIAKLDLGTQSLTAQPKNAVRLAGILENTLPAL